MKDIKDLTDDELKEVIKEKTKDILNEIEIEQIFDVITEAKKEIDKKYENNND
mgnify:CR=1 FL=1